MIGIVVVSHGKLAHELVRAAEHVVGPQTAFEALSIEAEDDIDARRDEIRDTVKNCNQGKGVIILTDMFGGTPSNLAIARLREDKVEVLAGVNLPMLLEFVFHTDLPLEELAEQVQDKGRSSIAQPALRG